MKYIFLPFLTIFFMIPVQISAQGALKMRKLNIVILLTVLFFLPAILFASLTEKRIALVIGNSDYIGE